MLHFLLSAVYTTSKESEDDVVCSARDRYDSIRENSSFCFGKLDFLAEEKEDRPVDICRDDTSNTLTFGRVRRH